LGARHGVQAAPANLAERVQDYHYLLKTAKRLHTIAVGEQREQVFMQRQTQRTDAYFKILAWEIGFHEMFWDELDEGCTIVHPTLGRGKIKGRTEKSMIRDGYVAKLIFVEFDSGQSCTFHSRVQNNEKVSESLAADIASALQL